MTTHIRDLCVYELTVYLDAQCVNIHIACNVILTLKTGEMKHTVDAK